MKTGSFWILTYIVTSFFGLNAQNLGTMTDTRDGKVYKTIKVGNQVWMAENLNFASPNSWCEECDIYGRIYNFEEAKVSCPPGWHLPSSEEWEELVNNLGGKEIAGGKMKVKELWRNPNTGQLENVGATDEAGFSGKPAHYRTTDKKIRDADFIATWWTSSEGPSPAIWTWNLFYDKASIECMGYLKSSGFSVRCVKDYLETTSDVSSEKAKAFLSAFDLFPQVNTMVLIYLNKSIETYNKLSNDPKAKIDFDELFTSYVSAYAVDSAIINEIGKITEVDPGFDLKKKHMEFYKAEMKLIKEFNNFFSTIKSKRRSEEIESFGNKLMIMIDDVNKAENSYKSAEKYFKLKYKLE